MKAKVEEKPEEKITRQEALKKIGKFVAFTAVASIILLTPKDSQAGSLKTGSPNANSPALKGWGGAC